MKNTLTLTLLVVLSLPVSTATAQSKLNFDSLVAANAVTFKAGSQFSGKGWDQLIEKSRRTNYVLIGEDHFISEIPLFTQAFAQQIKPDNYICEIDPWMLTIFNSKITKSSASQLDKWIAANYNGFSFFQKKNEFALMRSLLDQKVKLIGTEQVGLMSLPILYQYLAETGSAKNKTMYETMRDSSTAMNNRFFADMNKPFFMVSPSFTEMMGRLDKASMKPDEAALTSAMTRSAAIYQTGSHRDRIKLMQQHFMELYPQAIKGKKNLFKFGANHTIKGESYIPVYDLGTTANILAQAENQDSYHIMIMPRSGEQAGFLTGKNNIDLTEGIYASLKPFFDKASTTEWTTFDFEAIRAAIRKNKFPISDRMLEKTILGYDALVVIPVATAAEPLK
jgi:hypothetical protein